MKSPLENRVALVTGASRGIGAAIAKALGEAGASVAINFLNRRSAAEAVAKHLDSNGARAILAQADVTQKGEVDAMAGQVAKELGSIDILVNNAGVTRPQPVEEITEDDWDELIDVNLKSAFLVTQAVLPAMRKQQWGRIINLSSVAAQLGGVVGPHYAASKAGVIGLSHGYAAMLAKEGITVNAIAPALVETGMVTSNPRARPDIIPVGRFGHVDETASAAVMLATNGYITGQTINVNGGWYMS